MESTVQIRPVTEADLGSLRETVNEVCSEKWCLATVEGLKSNARKIEGRYQDIQLMARTFFSRQVGIGMTREKKLAFTTIKKLLPAK